MEHDGRASALPDFGTLLRSYRIEAGLSQEALAERARVSLHGISALERGYRQWPRRETLELLARALALDDGQRQVFLAAAARPSLPRRRGETSVTIGPWATVQGANLPFSLASFIGRAAELDEIAALARAHRLVTITGAGGIGKTQTALHVAEELDDLNGGAVRFVGFAPIRDPSRVVSKIASALNVQEVPDRPLLATVIAYLKNRAMLLIIDNCEHVIAEAANVVASLLSACQQVRILATSREPLKTAGEYEYRLPSLDKSSGVTLFGDRAHAVDQHFALTEDNVTIVAEICRRLDGIPLAIELAAARAKVLSLKTLVEKLDDRFRILTGGERTALPRHQTMRAAIEWSYDLLTPQERLLLARLGVFAGGATLDAAGAVCLGGVVDEINLFDLLASLTDKSLVVADTSGDTERFRLLESTAAYALEKLAAGRERERMARRHAEYFRDQAEAADRRFDTSSTIMWVAGLEPELDNYRVVLEWALTQGNDPVMGGAIAGALEGFWLFSGLAVEGRYWMELALPRVSESDQPAIAARLHLGLANFLDGERKYEAADRAMQLYHSIGDLRDAARSQQWCAYALWQVRRLDEAREANAQALAASRACGDATNVARCLSLLAGVEFERGNFRAARECLAQALAVLKALGHELGAAVVLNNMAQLELMDGHPEQALRLTNEALELAFLAKPSENTASWHTNSAAYRIALGDLTGARESAREGFRIARQVQHELRLAEALELLALLAALGNEARRGAQLIGYAAEEYRKMGMRRGPTDRWGYDKLLGALRETLSNDEIETLSAEGAAWSEDQAIEEALKV